MKKLWIARNRLHHSAVTTVAAIVIGLTSLIVLPVPQAQAGLLGGAIGGGLLGGLIGGRRGAATGAIIGGIAGAARAQDRRDAAAYHHR